LIGSVLSSESSRGLICGFESSVCPHGVDAVTAEAEPLPIATNASVSILTRADFDALQSITIPDDLLSVDGVLLADERSGPAGSASALLEWRDSNHE